MRRFREGDLQARISNPEKSDLSTLAIAHNEMADTIVENIESLKSVDNLRRELIANLSHDLRTPLAIMQGYIETMQLKGDNLTKEDKDKYLNIIYNSSEKLNHLISQLFEYSKLEAKQITPQKEPFQIADLAYDIKAKYDILAEAKNITIGLNIEKDIPLVFADISLVERVIQNLMDNALKFTEEGGKVELNIGYSDKDVLMTILDDGPGISADDQKAIFERYRQADKASAAKGVGLGLAIVKKILEIHDSTIEVISEPNRGTAFQFRLQAV